MQGALPRVVGGANLLDYYNGEGGTGCLHRIEWSAIMDDNRPHRIQLGIDTSHHLA